MHPIWILQQEIWILLREKNIGVSKDNIVEDVLNEWESKYGLHTKHINVSNTTEIMDKLSKHEIDCFVSVEESRWEESDISPVTSIGETEIYFAINPKRPDIKEALDSAMRRIKDDNPFYTDDLYRRYLSAQSSSFLSKEEKGVDRAAWSNPDRVSESGWRYQQCRSINRQTDRCYHRLCGSCRKLSARSDSRI